MGLPEPLRVRTGCNELKLDGRLELPQMCAWVCNVQLFLDFCQGRAKIFSDKLVRIRETGFEEGVSIF